MYRSLARLLALCALPLAHHGVAVAAGCPPPTKPLTPELFAQAAKHSRDRGLLWSINKGNRVSYLYGTFHLGKEEWMAPGPAVRNALRETEVIALELDPLDPQLPQQIAEGAARIERNLSAPLKKRLAAAWEAQCLPAGQLGSQPSEFHVMALIVALAMRDGLDAGYGSEILLSLIGKGVQRPVVSLETAASQLGALFSQDVADASRFVADSLDDIEQGKTRRVLVKTAAVWEQGDLAQLERYAQWCECLDTESERKFMSRMLDGRNPALADRIDALHLKGPSVFAAIGALHMVGPSGLPALLEKRGYVVRRLH